jgi:hypothetical protein
VCKNLHVELFSSLSDLTEQSQNGIIKENLGKMKMFLQPHHLEGFKQQRTSEERMQQAT